MKYKKDYIINGYKVEYEKQPKYSYQIDLVGASGIEECPRSPGTHGSHQRRINSWLKNWPIKNWM